MLPNSILLRVLSRKHVFQRLDHIPRQLFANIQRPTESPIMSACFASLCPKTPDEGIDEYTYPARINVEWVAPWYSFTSHLTPSRLSSAPYLLASSASRSQSPIAMTVRGHAASNALGAKLGDAVQEFALDGSGRYLERYQSILCGVRNGAYWFGIHGSESLVFLFLLSVVIMEVEVDVLNSDAPAVLSITGRIRSWPRIGRRGVRRLAFMARMVASPPPLI